VSCCAARCCGKLCAVCNGQFGRGGRFRAPEDRALCVHKQHVPQPHGRGDCKDLVCPALRVRSHAAQGTAWMGHSIRRAHRRGGFWEIEALSLLHYPVLHCFLCATSCDAAFSAHFQRTTQDAVLCYTASCALHFVVTGQHRTLSCVTLLVVRYILRTTSSDAASCVLPLVMLPCNFVNTCPQYLVRCLGMCVFQMCSLLSNCVACWMRRAQSHQFIQEHWNNGGRLVQSHSRGPISLS